MILVLIAILIAQAGTAWLIWNMTRNQVVASIGLDTQLVNLHKTLIEILEELEE